MVRYQSRLTNSWLAIAMLTRRDYDSGKQFVGVPVKEDVDVFTIDIAVTVSG